MHPPAGEAGKRDNLENEAKPGTLNPKPYSLHEFWGKWGGENPITNWRFPKIKGTFFKRGL